MNFICNVCGKRYEARLMYGSPNICDDCIEKHTFRRMKERADDIIYDEKN